MYSKPWHLTYAISKISAEWLFNECATWWLLLVDKWLDHFLLISFGVVDVCVDLISRTLVSASLQGYLVPVRARLVANRSVLTVIGFLFLLRVFLFWCLVCFFFLLLSCAQHFTLIVDLKNLCLRATWKRTQKRSQSCVNHATKVMNVRKTWWYMKNQNHTK